MSATPVPDNGIDRIISRYAGKDDSAWFYEIFGLGVDCTKLGGTYTLAIRIQETRHGSRCCYRDDCDPYGGCLRRLNKLYRGDIDEVWVCRECGNVVTGELDQDDEAPDTKCHCGGKLHPDRFLRVFRQTSEEDEKTP